jgi:membrane-bound lytic murein transglycosylase MltF
MKVFRIEARRISAALFPFVLLLSLFAAACEKNEPGVGADDLELLHPLDSHFGMRFAEDLDGILERRYIRVLTTFNRTNFFLSGAGLYGFEYSLLKDYEKHLNKSIRRRDLKVVMEFIPVSRDELLPALRDGRGDIAAAGLTITEERREQVDFTRPYLTGIDEVLVAHKDVEGLESIGDLSGREVFIRESSSYFESLRTLNDRLREEGRKPVKVLKAEETLETEDILEMVNSGAVPITVSDSHLASIWSGVLEDIRVHDTLVVRQSGEIAWAVRKGNPGLKESLDTFLRTRRKGTRLGNIYFTRYFENNRWIRNPVSEDMLRKSEKLRGLFQKYAERYGFDWTLIAAVAFQESRLNNKKRSPAGAVGIMQVRPSTAGDKNVGIDNVHELENNVHAGVKYLAFLRDRYFSDEALRESDRVRLTLAAYNAGPAKIRRARSEAEKMGLDPGRWFRNVEISALRLIGQEPVRYVSNINKYYILINRAFLTREIREEEREKLQADL